MLQLKKLDLLWYCSSKIDLRQDGFSFTLRSVRIHLKIKYLLPNEVFMECWHTWRLFCIFVFPKVPYQIFDFMIQLSILFVWKRITKGRFPKEWTNIFLIRDSGIGRLCICLYLNLQYFRELTRSRPTCQVTLCNVFHRITAVMIQNHDVGRNWGLVCVDSR